jgi:5-methyltetrahydropteroyltriglutamate--homocysteine methyltransferase
MMMLSKHKGKAKLALYLYFGDALPLYERLQSLPVDILGIDFTYNPHLVDRVVAMGAEKPLGLGLVDGRNTRLETPDEIAHQVDRILLRVKYGVSYLNPSCGTALWPSSSCSRKSARW